MIRINVDDVDTSNVTISEKAAPVFPNFAVGVTFHDAASDANVTLWASGDDAARKMQALLLRALQRLEAFTSTGASGLPKNKPFRGG